MGVFYFTGGGEGSRLEKVLKSQKRGLGTGRQFQDHRDPEKNDYYEWNFHDPA